MTAELTPALRTRYVRGLAVGVTAALALLGALASPAPAAAAKSTCPATFQVLHDDRIGELKLPAGHYTVTLLDPQQITCAKASSLFTKFLQDYDGKLPGKWKLNVAKQKFTKGGGFGFIVQRASGGTGGGGQHPSGTFDKCPTFRVLNDDRIGRIKFPAGTYAMTALGGLTCQKASSAFARFLQRFEGNLPGGWSLDGKTGTFTKGSTGLGFQVNFRR